MFILAIVYLYQVAMELMFSLGEAREHCTLIPFKTQPIALNFVPVLFSSVFQFRFYRYPVHSTSSLFYRQENKDQAFTGFSENCSQSQVLSHYFIISPGEELWQMMKTLTSMQCEKHLLKTGPPKTRMVMQS